MGLPFFLALCAFILNRPTKEKPLTWHLTPAQKFNIEVLQTYLKTHSAKYADKNPEELKSEIAKNGWDFAVVDRAVDDYCNSLNNSE